jgi:hypothetical protein
LQGGFDQQSGQFGSCAVSALQDYCSDYLNNVSGQSRRSRKSQAVAETILQNSEESRNEKVKYWLNIVIVGELIVKIKRQARIAISIRFCSSPW